MTRVTVVDNNCDSRSTVVDLNDNNGFLLEYVMSKGCNKTGSFPDEYVYDNDGMHYIYVTVYACNSLGCSSGYKSGVYPNGRWP